MGVLFELAMDGFEVTSPLDSVNFNKLYAEAVDALNGYESIFGLFEESTESIELYNEAVERSGIKKVLKRTGEQIDMTRKSYDDVTQGAGDAMHSGVKVSLRVANWISKVISLICKFIGWIPEAIDALMRKIAKINGKIWHKLTGKFDLNITIDDLKYFEKNVIPKIDEFIMLCKAFADRNKKWKDGVANKIKKKVVLDDTDFKRYNQMVKLMAKLSTVKISPTALPIKSDFVKDTYFNKDSDYFKKLQEFNSYFTQKKTILEELQHEVADKRNDSLSNGTYFHLSQIDRAKVDHAERMIGQFLNVILKIYKNIQEDINTLSKLSDKIK